MLNATPISKDKLDYLNSLLDKELDNLKEQPSEFL